MPSPPDRPIHILEQSYPAYPLPPLQMFVFSPMQKGMYDVRWSDPTELSANSKFNIIGVNIYRSFDSECGPFYRLNATPVGSTFWRDRATTTVALNEDISGSFASKGSTTGPGTDWTFVTKNKPIVIVPTGGQADCTNLNVQVTVNGVSAFVKSIDSATGAVTLSSGALFDVANQQTIQPVLPTNTNDVVLATYKYIANDIPTNLNIRAFYRITTVAYDASTGTLIETPLNRAAKANNREVEKLDYMWTEAIRRQRWLLERGGERVKVFIRRVVGPKCGCNSSLYKQPNADCPVCFGGGIIGGYEGPYDIIVSPDDAEKKAVQTNMGRSISHPYDTWTGPSPLLSQRDFIVKLNGDRYGLGPVRMPSNRGMLLQQYFQLSRLDEPDVRYKVPVPDPMYLKYPETRFLDQCSRDKIPMITDDSRIPAERQLRGNTPTWGNTEYR